MMRTLLLLFLALWTSIADAHVGSPDLFYSGKVGPYPARITIRMPRVIPGRAEISARMETSKPLEVSFLPLYARTDSKNAPPPDPGLLVSGETNLYAGELWLMSFGAYSVEVRVKGPDGNGTVQIPLTSVATSQLPMPDLLRNILLALGGLLALGAIGIAFAAAREGALASGQLPGRRERRMGLLAATVVVVILTGAVYGGLHWWNAEERAFRRHLREGAWPDLTANVKVAGNQTILRLELGKDAFKPPTVPPLISDHGKLIHLFLIREGSGDVFAHVHPIRKGGHTFELAVPPLPAGRYTIYCDLTYEGGTSSTATASVELPGKPVTATNDDGDQLDADPDDSWAVYDAGTVPKADEPKPVFRCADGTTVRWLAEKPIRIQQDASLRFEVRDPNGSPVLLEPYMGMLSHAAVRRRDGAVFSHLHPSGNYSMAAQTFFAAKLARETNPAASGMAAAGAHHASHPAAPPPSASAESSLYLPYEFPEPGDYRIWVQFKTGGKVQTAVFDARVQ